MIKNIVFDIGNVLLKFTPVEFLKSKYKDDKLVEALYENVFKSNEWVELDRGTITEEEATCRFCKRDPHNAKYIREVMETWNEMHVPVEGTSELMKELREKGYKIYLLSNYHLKAFKLISDKYDFIRDVDGGIISSKVKLLKPELEIYKALTNSCGIKPEESIFIDDREENVEAAIKLGFNGIVFKDAYELKGKFDELGIAI
ncbi:putative hydrolase of the HAD superfamily [Clostridium acetobutylicum]|uniref:HAD superfamily hydrolase n=1 Tax=Clostridium acetobutylicum (strain ATCC 824 / DSM 792 / JCM 1419 / IAM 19013 / LMG 5710 / NBRC 13948 / NRRL B-527 / VKM B-1787 / 2291 / W) TaxID=272562 RepID=Q97D99_CLOAB|nr:MULTISPECIES: HAD family phosphatase [Clostridium]AAK81504.1 HAD superfamily hydrolase [Clostridium acetobutylicum ATCC 824]ADZ22625.1 HAD superfamily hydrolase [Clostridium acetobutylicum EA 2018]AEI32940.1 HAD family phosphatase [Clostridium acetobutylicum DSM 1731]AWV80822.1 HAD family phosphatase [Clostridium acetobutylicum]MBC2393852.1 HAD family phosphatase [Clostridium acetobutylicum]